MNITAKTSQWWIQSPPIQTSTTSSTNALSDGPNFGSLYVYVSIFLPAILCTVCACWACYRLCFTYCCPCRQARRQSDAGQHSTATSVFTVNGETGDSIIGRSNTAAVFEDMPPSYDDVILTNNSSTMIIDNDGLPRYETFIVETQPNVSSVDRMTSPDNRKSVRQLVT